MTHKSILIVTQGAHTPSPKPLTNIELQESPPKAVYLHCTSGARLWSLSDRYFLSTFSRAGRMGSAPAPGWLGVCPNGRRRESRRADRTGEYFARRRDGSAFRRPDHPSGSND